jgi:hypothetical protein
MSCAPRREEATPVVTTALTTSAGLVSSPSLSMRASDLGLVGAGTWPISWWRSCWCRLGGCWGEENEQ